MVTRRDNGYKNDLIMGIITQGISNTTMHALNIHKIFICQVYFNKVEDEKGKLNYYKTVRNSQCKNSLQLVIFGKIKYIGPLPTIIFTINL
jgi:hypothetical protein